MNRIKCARCGLVNSTSDVVCRRCGAEGSQLFPKREAHEGPREAAKKSTWLYTLLFLSVIGGGFYYLYNGLLQSFEQVQSTEANRLAPPPKQTPAPLTSRSESDQKRVEPYKNAIRNAPGLAESQKRVAETQKLMQPERKKE